MSESKPVTFPCPRCKQPATWQNNPARPFCSERCKLIDLGAWANEDYKIASQAAPELTDPEPKDD